MQKQPPRFSALGFVLRCTLWGLLLGTLGGVVLFLPYSLAYYGLFGILFNTCIGGILGLINGFVLAIIRRSFVQDKNVPYQRKRWIAASLITLIASLILFSLMMEPLTQHLDGSPNLAGAIVCGVPPALVAMLIVLVYIRRTRVMDAS